jgi:tetratricopeptide (TPR) repeat protein
LVHGTLSPFSLWFQTDFPLATLVFWLQWLAWGEHPGWYHVLNIALQAGSAVLLWRLLARLKIPGAWLAGILFAVHPVCVASVGRIAELKNLLSLPFFLLSFMAYLRHETRSMDQNHPNNPSRNVSAGVCYGFSLIFFALALLSKTSTVMLPMVLLACAAWQRGRITRRDLIYTSPFFVLALAFGLMSAWFQKHLALAGQSLPHQSFFERLAIAGRVLWFYLGKAVLPVKLCLVYPRWKVDSSTLAAYVPLLLLCAGCAVCWHFRRSWGRHVLLALGCFALTLLPVLGFVDAQYLTWFQVSDHLQYLPLIGPVALLAAGIASIRVENLSRVAAVALITALSILTFHRARVFATEESLWRDTLAKNSKAGLVHSYLGLDLAKQGRYPEAIEHFTASLESGEDNVDAHLNLGRALGLQGNSDQARQHFIAALQLAPDSALAHQSFATVLRLAGNDREARIHLEAALRLKPENETRLTLSALLYKTGDFNGCAARLREVLSRQPDLPEALNNLAWLLATCSDEGVRNGREAIRHAERACHFTGFKQTNMVGTLAAAYAEAGLFPEAVATGKIARDLATAAGEQQFAAISQQLLNQYLVGKPWHESPPAER